MAADAGEGTPTGKQPSRRSVRIIGGGRAGASMAAAMSEAGWHVQPILGRDSPRSEIAAAAIGTDLVLIATPDAVVATVAAAIRPAADTVVAHLCGSLGLDVLAPHELRASLHPVMSLPDAAIGARRLLDGGWFAVAGDPLVRDVVTDLGGQVLEVHDADRAAYHAAAVIASNHLVALLGQAERVAATAGVPFAALMDLVHATVDNVAGLGPARALTGPAARGDDETLRRHLEAIAPSERTAYEALAEQARRLATEQHQQR